MSATLWIFTILAGIFGGGWVVRAVGQAIPWSGKDRMVYFRDMSYLAGVGLAIGIGAILFAVYLYFFGTSAFIGWAINGFLGFAVVAYYFRLIGINIGTEGSKKFFRQMPLTAAFGILVIIVYAFFSIFAGQISVITVFFVAFVGLLFCLAAERRYTAEATKMIVFIVLFVVALFTAMFFIGPLAPYGQEEVFAKANLLPGGDAATGGDPAHLLGTDQIGRDILSRIIYGAQNTVGIAFVTTCLAFLIGITMGFMAAIKGGWADQLFSRIVDALMAIPQLIFALLLMTIATAWAGSDKALVTIYMILIIAVLDSTRVYRLSRAVGLNIVVMDYIEAAKLRGENISYLVFKGNPAERICTFAG